MKVIFCTNLPSPYRVDFFNEFGKLCDLTVCYERRSSSERDSRWKGADALTYKEVYLELIPVGADRSKGRALQEYIARHPVEILILTNYVSPASMKAIFNCKRKNLSYWIEYDGGFNKKDSLINSIIKKSLLRSAIGHLTTCEEHIVYLKSIGIRKELIYKYPFTSVTSEDLSKADLMTQKGKDYYRELLEIHEKTVVLSVGQFIYRKGYDILLHSAKKLKKIGIYIVGGKPTDEYLQIMDELQLDNVHFIDFKNKEALSSYYCAADLFVLPTREDIWGLVINEAMAFSLPVVTTERCLAGLELIQGNGSIIPAENPDILADTIETLVNNKELLDKYSKKSREIISGYTIEKMAHRHMEIFQNAIDEEQ